MVSITAYLFGKVVVKCEIGFELFSVVTWKFDIFEVSDALYPEQVTDRNGSVAFHQQHVDAIFPAGGILDQPRSVLEQLFEFTGF